MKNPLHLCPLCGGEKIPGTTTFSVDIGSGVVVVRHVGATVCQQCGEEWIDNATAKRLEKIVAKSRAEKPTVAVMDLAAA